MGRSQETFGKKEVRNKKEKKRKEKAQKRAIKKSEGKKNSFNDMIAYVDELGMISSTPPDPGKKVDIIAENIELKITRNNPRNSPDFLRKGVVSTFNKSKGYGFIRDMDSNQSVFVHVNNLEEPVMERDIVVFEIGKGAKGPAAMKVRLYKEPKEGEAEDIKS
jgi:cold shock CspA family protein